MESWLLGVKLALVLFLAVHWIAAGVRDGPVAILLLLAYVCIGTLYHVTRKARWKRSFLILSFIEPAFCAVAVDPSFALLLPLGGAELIVSLTRNNRTAPLPAIVPLFFLPRNLWQVYLFCAVFAVFVYFLTMKVGTRLQALQNDNDSLRASNEEQRRRAAAGAEYEDQLRRLTQLEERNNLAREVHDRVGHAIAGSVVQLEAASALLPNGKEQANRLIRQSIDALRDGMESIRAALRGLKPAPEELGIQRLRALLDQFAANSSIRPHLAFSGNLGLITPAQWAIILDNIREALTNVIKHSGATSVWATIETMPKLLKVEIRDDGRGAYALKKGLGIRGIEERMAQEAGTLIVDGMKGFSVIMLFPMEAARAD